MSENRFQGIKIDRDKTAELEDLVAGPWFGPAVFACETRAELGEWTVSGVAEVLYEEVQAAGHKDGIITRGGADALLTAYWLSKQGIHMNTPTSTERTHGQASCEHQPCRLDAAPGLK